MKARTICMLIPFLFVGTILIPLRSEGQLKLTPKQSRDKLVANKIGKDFVLEEQMKAIDGKGFDFSHIQRPVFIYIGEAYCLICKFEFPVFLEMVKQFPEIDFIYLSTDPDSILQKKIGKANAFDNLYAIRVERNFLWDKDIAKVYPVKYFLNSQGPVVDAATGGRMKDRDLVKQEWISVLDTLK